MRDTTDRAITDVLTAIEDVAPAAPELPTREPVAPRVPFLRPAMVAATTFAAVLLVVGLGAVGLMGDRTVDDTDAAQGSGDAPAASSDQTVATATTLESTTTLASDQDAAEGTEGRGNPIGRPLTAERDRFADITSENPYGSSAVFTSLEAAFVEELEGSTLAAWLVELATPEHRFEAADYSLPDGSRIRLAWRDSIAGQVSGVGTSRLPGAPDDVRYYGVSADSGNFEIRWMTTEYEGVIGFYDGAAIPQARELEEMVLRQYDVVIEQARLSGSASEAYAALANRLGAEPISAEELERITGLPPHAAESGYRVFRTSLDDPNAELGLIMYRDTLSGSEEDIVYTCFHDYAIVDGLSGVGGARCAPTIEKATQIAASDVALSGSCGLGTKETPGFIDGAWTLLTIWGIPSGVDAIEIGFGNGTAEALEASESGIVQMLWADPEDILSIDYDGMTQRHTDVASRLPYPAIDCGPDDGSRG